MKYRNGSNKGLRIICIVFGIVGACYLAIAIFSFLICKNVSATYVKTQATITDIVSHRYSSRSATFIEYEADGQIVRTAISEYRSSWNIGQKITVYYDPDQPQKATTGMFGVIFPLAFSIVGGVFVAVALIVFCVNKQFKKKKQFLLEHGTLICAKVMDIEINTRVSFNRRHPVAVKCRYEASDGKIHIFHSGDIWTYVDPAACGASVNVYIDGEDYSKYYVDADSIPGCGNVEEHY